MDAEKEQMKRRLEALTNTQLVRLAWLLSVSVPDAMIDSMLKYHTISDIEQALRLGQEGTITSSWQRSSTTEASRRVNNG
jgi:hypothetical protein